MRLNIMALIGYPEIFLAVLCFLVLCYLSNRNQLLINWPLVGMLPQMLLNVHRLYDWFITMAEKCEGTYIFKGPWFANLDMLGTVNPANVQYIMSTNFANYPKGAEFKKMFDIFGDGLLGADSDSWKYQRKKARALTTNRQFLQVLAKTSRDKVEKGLIPFLEHVCTNGLVVDLQSLVHRFSFDISITLVTGYDPQNLSITFPKDPFSEAMDVIEDIIFYRHLTPEIFWKLQRGPWFANMDMLVTVNPANVQYIMSTNFANYPKGTEFKKMFDIFGDGLFSADSDSWKYQRKIAKSLTTTRQFLQVLAKISGDKVEKGLIPVLEHVCTHGLVVDLQSLVHRFSFDIGIALVTGNDPQNLSINFPKDPFSEAMDVIEDIIFYRHVTPEIFWKLQRWLGFGLEPKMKESWETVDNIIADYISRKRKELSNENNLQKDGEFADFLTSYITMEGEISRPDKDKFMRDTMFNFLIAGRENSLSWFFWLVYTNPGVLGKIREELKSLAPANEGEQKWCLFDVEDLKKLVYLHAAICEALRLYPAVPIEHKAPIKPDVLPSGHQVDPKKKIIFSAFVMGRMKFIWGEDCLEFKPERFITEGGGIKQVPTYKFVAFNTGPRTCIGKEIALTQMKAMAAAVIHNYDVEVVEGHPVVPHCASIILHMKHGLMEKEELETREGGVGDGEVGDGEGGDLGLRAGGAQDEPVDEEGDEEDDGDAYDGDGEAAKDGGLSSKGWRVVGIGLGRGRQRQRRQTTEEEEE
ncbi:hypothetical protein Tsubulata_037680, partial [Turnera subulata]